MSVLVVEETLLAPNLKSCSLVKRRRKRHSNQGSINQPIQIVAHAVKKNQGRGVKKWRSLAIKGLPEGRAFELEPEDLKKELLQWEGALQREKALR